MPITQGKSCATGTHPATTSGRAAPTAKLAAEAKAACRGLALSVFLGVNQDVLSGRHRHSARGAMALDVPTCRNFHRDVVRPECAGFTMVARAPCVDSAVWKPSAASTGFTTAARTSKPL